MTTVIRRRRRAPWIICLVLLISGYSAWCLYRPLPDLQPVQASPEIKLTTPASALTWPAAGQAAVSLLSSNRTESRGPQTPVPTASTAKVITALVILDKKPLQAGESGPMIALTADDVARYQSYVAQGGSVLPVQAGEQLSQYQMLQALLLPSANNIADTLALWAYGSLPAYQTAANNYLARHGLTATTVGSDASGLAPDTVSTASDLVKLGRLALNHSLIKQIVNQPSAAGFPLVNEIKNVNGLLGTNGIIGIKTGNSDQAGGTFMGAAQVVIDGRTETIITAVLGAPNRLAALQQSVALIQSAQANFKPIEIIKQGETVGNYYIPWGSNIPAIAYQDLSLTAWQGDPVKATGKLEPIKADAQAEQTVGRLSAHATTTPLKLKTTVPKPSAWWLLTHPLR